MPKRNRKTPGVGQAAAWPLSQAESEEGGEDLTTANKGQTGPRKQER